MSAAAARGELAAIGQALMAGTSPVERRARGFATPPAANENPSFDDLIDAPGWLRRDGAARRSLARRVALLAMAPALARSIDGGWLGHVAELCGEDEVDRAIAAANDDGETLPACPADAIEARGFALLRQSLPDRLRRFLPAPAAPSGLSDGRAGTLVGNALEGER